MRNEIFNELKETFDELIQIVSCVSEKELNKVPFEESWTAAQVAEHLLKSYGIVELLNTPQFRTERPADEKKGQLKDFFLNFSLKAKAAPAILPSENLIDKEKLLNSLKKRIAEIKEVAQTKDLTEVCESIVLPVFGALTKLEWLYLVLYHTRRHIHQIKIIFQTLKTNKNESSKSLSEF
ncbi:MAG TPA: DinB family protein [Hanamia sp.]|nr:DinB family protein [Hanamia sp.]